MIVGFEDYHDLELGNLTSTELRDLRYRSITLTANRYNIRIVEDLSAFVRSHDVNRQRRFGRKFEYSFILGRDAYVYSSMRACDAYLSYAYY